MKSVDRTWPHFKSNLIRNSWIKIKQKNEKIKYIYGGLINQNFSLLSGVILYYMQLILYYIEIYYIIYHFKLFTDVTGLASAKVMIVWNASLAPNRVGTVNLVNQDSVQFTIELRLQPRLALFPVRSLIWSLPLPLWNDSSFSWYTFNLFAVIKKDFVLAAERFITKNYQKRYTALGASLWHCYANF